MKMTESGNEESFVQRTFSLLPILLQLVITASLATAQEPPRPPAVLQPAPAGNQKQAAGTASQTEQAGFKSQIAPVNVRPTAEMKKILALLVTPGGAVLDQPGGKSLMIVDSPSNTERLLEIKELIDIPAFAGAHMEIFQPKMASAEELAAQMTEAMRTYVSSEAQTGVLSVEFIPFPRTNQILAVSYSENAWTYARRWLGRIDASSGPERRIFFYPVAEGKAVELVEKLKQVKSPAQGLPQILTDSITNSLIIYGTAQQFQEIKNVFSGSRQMEEFKQRLLALRRRFEAIIKDKTAP